MTNNNFLNHKFYYWGPYVAEIKVDPDYCKRLWARGKKLTRSHAKDLAGQIKDERLFDLEKDSWIAHELEEYVNTWIEGFRRFGNKPFFKPTGHDLQTMWINFTQPYEYNPVHYHNECDLSFVLYLKIPKQIRKEKHKTRASPPGFTTFLYGEEHWSTINSKIVLPEENTIVIFPSQIRHEVVHHTSKVCRVSIAGNIKFRGDRGDI